jgi:chromosome segregation ATPase
MKDGAIMAFLGFIAALLVVLKPVLDLNTSITELKVSIDNFRESVNKLDSRITEHGKELDKIRDRVSDHETRLKILEDK